MKMNKNNSGCGLMIGLFMALAFLMAMFGKNDGSPTGDDRINDIIAAKAYVRSLLNYPDTADFHDFKTEVTSTHVNLTVTAKNGFGVPMTQSFSVPRD
jgi:hypothetical protein